MTYQKKLNSPEATGDLRQYGRAMRTGNHSSAVVIEKKWGLYGYTPEIVSTVLSCVSTGLDLHAAINEATHA